jgi:hypothetical protein
MLINPYAPNDTPYTSSPGSILLGADNTSYYVSRWGCGYVDEMIDWCNNANSMAMLGSDKKVAKDYFTDATGTRETGSQSGSAWGPTKSWMGNVVWGDSHVDWHPRRIMDTRDGNGIYFKDNDIWDNGGAMGKHTINYAGY